MASSHMPRNLTSILQEHQVPCAINLGGGMSRSVEHHYDHKRHRFSLALQAQLTQAIKHNVQAKVYPHFQSVSVTSIDP
jgi:hypothetical protein